MFFGMVASLVIRQDSSTSTIVDMSLDRGTDGLLDQWQDSVMFGPHLIEDGTIQFDIPGTDLTEIISEEVTLELVSAIASTRAEGPEYIEMIDVQQFVIKEGLFEMILEEIAVIMHNEEVLTVPIILQSTEEALVGTATLELPEMRLIVQVVRMAMATEPQSTIEQVNEGVMYGGMMYEGMTQEREVMFSAPIEGIR